MDKLLNLLNKYKGGGFTYSPFGNFIRGEYDNFESVIPAEIISKKFGFIEWLVQNLKINIDELRKHGYITKTYDLDELGEGYSYLDWLLMLLAIQDEPIEFLISLLK